MRNSIIDLHIHSTASDGSVTPKQIVSNALEIGIKAISITDHDTLEGSREGLKYCRDNLEFITGVEISTSIPASFETPGSMHILGYGIDIDEKNLNDTLYDLQRARRDRNPKIIQKLKNLGLDISLEELSAKITGQMGRPHIAAVMKEKGFVDSIDQAFDMYLGTGKPAYVEKYRISPQKALEIILNSGGIASIAHPGLLKMEKSKIEELILNLRDMGLAGIEAYYPEHSRDFTDFLISFAKRLDMVITGGTDFHGDLKAGLNIGYGRGDFGVPAELYEKLIYRIKKDRQNNLK